MQTIRKEVTALRSDAAGSERTHSSGQHSHTAGYRLPTPHYHPPESHTPERAGARADGAAQRLQRQQQWPASPVQSSRLDEGEASGEGAAALSWRLDDMEKLIAEQAQQLAALKQQRIADLELTHRALAANGAQHSELRAALQHEASAAVQAAAAPMHSRLSATEEAVQDCAEQLQALQHQVREVSGESSHRLGNIYRGLELCAQGVVASGSAVTRTLPARVSMVASSSIGSSIGSSHSPRRSYARGGY
jgi:hypothetical protein